MQDPTTVTLLTPAGRGALATIAVEGAHAVSLVSRLFQPASSRPLQTIQLEQIVFGNWSHTDGRNEEVVVCRRTDRIVEVHCHGGRAAAEAILTVLVEQGARRVDAFNWVREQATDPIQAAASLALAEARTGRVAALLLDQYHGALRRALLEVVQRRASGDMKSSRALLARLADLGQLGRRITLTWRVVCAGPPNVGKSSLVNALLGFDRAIVLDQPGTTRDRVVAQTAIDGWPIELSDTAGLHPVADPIERAGVARAREAMRQADLVVLVFDATQPIQPAHEEQLDSWPEALVVVNKCDLCEGCSDVAWKRSDRDLLLTSALVGSGIDPLMNAIVARLIPRVPRAGEAVPFTVEQCQTIELALSLYASGDTAAGVAQLSSLTVAEHALVGQRHFEAKRVLFE